MLHSGHSHTTSDLRFFFFLALARARLLCSSSPSSSEPAPAAFACSSRSKLYSKNVRKSKAPTCKQLAPRAGTAILHTMNWISRLGGRAKKKGKPVPAHREGIEQRQTLHRHQQISVLFPRRCCSGTCSLGVHSAQSSRFEGLHDASFGRSKRVRLHAARGYHRLSHHIHTRGTTYLGFANRFEQLVEALLPVHLQKDQLVSIRKRANHQTIIYTVF